MPIYIRTLGYKIYFWSNENDPLEPIHVHVSEGSPNASATKIWITKAGKCYLCHNNSHIPAKILRNIMMNIIKLTIQIYIYQAELECQDIISDYLIHFPKKRYFLRKQ